MRALVAGVTTALVALGVSVLSAPVEAKPSASIAAGLADVGKDNRATEEVRWRRRYRGHHYRYRYSYPRYYGGYGYRSRPYNNYYYGSPYYYGPRHYYGHRHYKKRKMRRVIRQFLRHL